MYPGLALAASNGPALGSLLFLVLPLALLVFLMMSQRRRGREVAALQQSLEVGQDVVTTSGLFGTVRSLTGDEVALEVAPGVVVRFDRRAIGSRRLPADASPSGPVTEEP